MSRQSGVVKIRTASGRADVVVSKVAGEGVKGLLFRRCRAKQEEAARRGHDKVTWAANVFVRMCACRGGNVRAVVGWR